MKDARLSDSHRFGKKVTLSESTVEPGACYNGALSVKKSNKLSCNHGGIIPGDSKLHNAISRDNTSMVVSVGKTHLLTEEFKCKINRHLSIEMLATY